MALTTVESIQLAIHLIDTKKDNLKRAFEELQSRSALLSSFAVTWKDLDYYFTRLQSDVVQNFSNLQKTLEPSLLLAKPKYQITSKLVPAHQELKSLCEKMDGLGLRSYLICRQKELEDIRDELADAIKHSPDPGALVLDAMEGFCNREHNETEPKFGRVCLVLLEEFMRSGLEIGKEVQKRASAMAKEWDLEISWWNQVAGSEIRGVQPRLGYLILLASFKLFNDSAFNENELIEYVASVARCRQAVSLCRNLCLESRIHDVIQTILTKSTVFIALKFIFEFKQTDKFPPVTLLKSFLMDVTNNAQNVREDGNSSRQDVYLAEEKVINAVKSSIRCVKDYNLESQYPIDDLKARLDRLFTEKAIRKKTTEAVAPERARKKKTEPAPKLQTQNGKKWAKTVGEPSSVSKRKVRADNSPQPSKRAARYLDQPAGTYGRVGGLPVGDPAYVGLSADIYGLPRAPPGFFDPYPSGTDGRPGHYDARTVGYAGYGVPVPPQYRHRQLYYPQ